MQSTIENETPAQTAAAFRCTAAKLRAEAAQFHTPSAYLLGRAEKYERWAAEKEATLAPVAQVETAQPVAVEAVKVAAPAKVAKPRCPHFKAIKTFMAIARENGLDTTAKDRCRGAVGVLLGRRIESRADLTGAEWEAMGAAIKAGRLWW